MTWGSVPAAARNRIQSRFPRGSYTARVSDATVKQLREWTVGHISPVHGGRWAYDVRLSQNRTSIAVEPRVPGNDRREWSRTQEFPVNPVQNVKHSILVHMQQKLPRLPFPDRVYTRHRLS